MFAKRILWQWSLFVAMVATLLVVPRLSMSSQPPPSGDWLSIDDEDEEDDENDEDGEEDEDDEDRQVDRQRRSPQNKAKPNPSLIT